MASKRKKMERLTTGEYVQFRESAKTGSFGSGDLFVVTLADPRYLIVDIASVPGGRTHRVNEALLKRAPMTVVRSHGR